MQEFVTRFSSRLGVKLVFRKFKMSLAVAEKFAKKFSLDVGNLLEMNYRGYVYCSWKSAADKPNKSIRSSCSFRIPYIISEENLRTYIINKPKVTLQHSHALEVCDALETGLELVKYDHQLSQPEKDFMLSLGPHHLGAGKLLEIMTARFNREYSAHLVRRWIDKSKIILRGESDPDNWRWFSEQAAACVKDGGVYEQEFDDVSLHLTKLYFQLRQMKEYANAFGRGDGFVYADGSHKMNVYDMIVVTYLVIDCLGMSKICGLHMSPWEDYDAVLKAFDLFGICGEGDCFMTDEGAGLVLAAAKRLGLEHLLCAWHYQIKIMRNATGVPARFAKFVNDVIYQSFGGSIEKLESKFDEMRSEFSENQQALKCIDDIEEKVSSLFTLLYSNLRSYSTSFVVCTRRRRCVGHIHAESSRLGTSHKVESKAAILISRATARGRQK